MTGLVLFAVALMFLFFGYSVAFTFAGISLIVGVLSLGTDLFAFMPYRIMSIMENTTLMAIPMFIFMGIVLQKTGLAEKLLESSAKLFGQVAGGLAISTIIVGALLAASTGVVGASVVAMGVISLPVMLKNNYHQPTATGVICASGTLGQIIPPSIILIINSSPERYCASNAINHHCVGVNIWRHCYANRVIGHRGCWRGYIGNLLW